VGVTLPWCFRPEATRPNDKLQKTWDKSLGGPVSEACVLKIRGMKVLGEINAAIDFRVKKINMVWTMSFAGFPGKRRV
jgi:hypothetical protein